MYDNKAAYSYLEDSTSCAFHLHTTRRPCGTKGRVSVNSTDGPGELPLLASLSASFSARGLSPSADSLPGRASATRALFASAVVLGRRWSGQGMSGCGGVVDRNPPARNDRQHEELGGFQDGWWAPVPRSTALRSGAHPGLESLGVPPDPAPDQEGVTY
jgi:hypothetical protein